MAIKDKYCDQNRFRNVENLDSLFVTRTHKPRVIIGDAPDIRTCMRLYQDRIVHNWPSQWHSRYPDGYISFASGRKYDRKRLRINGQEAFIFPITEVTEIFWEKSSTKERIIAKLQAASDKDFRAIFDVFCERAGRQYKGWWSRDSAEQYLLSQLEAMGLQELRDWTALLECPAGSPSPESPSKAA